MAQYYDEIKIPVTVIAGSSDQMVNVDKNLQKLSKELQNSKLILLENTGHKLHHTHPDVVIKAIENIDEN